jgi:hypothetical protein
MAKHVNVDGEGQLGSLASSLDHSADTHATERLPSLIDEDIGRPGLALQSLEASQFIALKVVNAIGAALQPANRNGALANPGHPTADRRPQIVWGQAIGVDIDRDGTSLWVFDRCGGKTCEGSNIAPIQKFGAAGRLVVSFGSGLFKWPHGLFAAPDGTVWVTDGKNQTVTQFAPDGHLLMTLGRPGVAGNGPDEFNSPSDVLVAPNGDIFVADGHGDFPVPKTNDRIVKYSKDGKFIKTWGHHGSGQGEFDVAMGSPWIPPVACSSPIERITASRSSIRMENS